MNFSEEYDCEKGKGRSCQSIFFATSKDLLTWTRLPFAPPPANDSNVFKYGKGYTVGGRWDCIATVPKPGSPGEFYGYWTASPEGHGGAGVGETIDQTGYHWRALPPITAGMPNAEVGSTVVINGKYYMLYSGGHLYTSDNPIQGYVTDPVNPDFHTDGNGVAFSRLWNVQGQTENETVLLTHQWVVRGGSESMIYLAPIKEAKVGADGTLRAMWWPGNEKLKGSSIELRPGSAHKGVMKVKLEQCTSARADRQGWSFDSTNGRIHLASNSSLCLGTDTRTIGVVSCASVLAATFHLASNGSLLCNNMCVQAEGGTLTPTIAACSNSSSRWGMGNSAPTEIFLQTNGPLAPVALWQFEHADHLGLNTGSAATAGADDLKCTSGQGCAAASEGDDARANALGLSSGAYLGYNGDKGVPSGVPIGSSSYTVAGWVLPQELVAISRRPSRPGRTASGADLGGMMGMVGWGDFNSDYGSNAFATNLPSGFWNYWFFNGGKQPDMDLEFPAPGIGDGLWGHVLCRYDDADNTRDCFWNGVLAKSDKPSVPRTTHAGTFRIGNTHFHESFVGQLDDIAIFNRSLKTQTEVVQAMAGDYTGSGSSGTCLTAVKPHTSGPGIQAVSLHSDLDLAVGVVVEASMSCDSASTAGFLVGAVGSSTASGTAFVWDCSTQRFVVGEVQGGQFKASSTIDRKPGFQAKADVQLRLLARNSVGGLGMVEFYVNDVISHPWTVNPPSKSTLGSLFAVQVSNGTMSINIESAKAWRMTLPAE